MKSNVISLGDRIVRWREIYDTSQPDGSRVLVKMNQFGQVNLEVFTPRLKSTINLTTVDAVSLGEAIKRAFDDL